MLFRRRALGELSGAEQRIGARVRKSRQKEAAGTADAVRAEAAGATPAATSSGNLNQTAPKLTADQENSMPSDKQRSQVGIAGTMFDGTYAGRNRAVRTNGGKTFLRMIRLGSPASSASTKKMTLALIEATNTYHIPLDPVLAEILFAWKRASEFCRETDWVFASPQKAGELPLRSTAVLANHIKPAAITAGLGSRVGWHTFRHTYSSMLRQLGVDLKVQQELLRHADVRTTMNVYTQAVSEQKRAAHSSVVRMVLA